MAVDMDRVLVRREILQLEDIAFAALGVSRAAAGMRLWSPAGQTFLLIAQNVPAELQSDPSSKPLRFRFGDRIGRRGGGEGEGHPLGSIEVGLGDAARREAAPDRMRSARRGSPLPVRRASGTGSGAK